MGSAQFIHNLCTSSYSTITYSMHSSNLNPNPNSIYPLSVLATKLVCTEMGVENIIFEPVLIDPPSRFESP